MKELLQAFDLLLNFLMQMTFIIGSVYMVEVRGWNGWWIALGLLLAATARPDLLGRLK